jgi:hypothetical protein
LLQNKFLKDKEELEYRIKEFKEQKKFFEYNYNSFNNRISRLNTEVVNTKIEKENFNLNKAIFTMMNMNLKTGQTDEQINDNIQAKYIEKTSIAIPQKHISTIFKNEKIDKNISKEKVKYSKTDE